jgi:tRNA-2-methylthio-N6-dimethylallyladenosine synthase
MLIQPKNVCDSITLIWENYSMTADTPKYHVWTIGCQMNEADSRRLAASLEAMGYAPTSTVREADLVVVNTCVVRKLAEDKCIQRLMALRHLKSERPHVRVAVMGCLVGFRPGENLQQMFPFVDVFMPPSDFRPLLSFLKSSPLSSAAEPNPSRAPQNAWLEDEETDLLPPSLHAQTASAFVPVVLGCSFACTFCVIPYRRGAERSRPPEVILDEVRRLADSGIREVTLLGQIVDRYGLDLGDGVNLAGLLREVGCVPGIMRARFLTSHPNWFTENLLNVLTDSDKVCPQIELPVQAGNDEVLKRMRRGYTADDYRRLVERIRQRLPDCGLSTDVIVGFPGETDEQFMDTYRLMEELQPDMIRIAKYSERPQTYAARHLPDEVPEEEKERRRAMLDDLLEHMLLKKHADWLGREVEILVDHREKDGRWCGRTPQGKLVFFRDDGNWLGRLARVRLTWVAAFSLAGELADAAADPAPAPLEQP